MKKWLPIMLTLALMLSTAAAEGTGKYHALPPIFALTVETDDRLINNDEGYVYKEYLNTVNSTVNAEIRELVDAYDDQLVSLVPPNKKKKAKHNNWLNVTTTYYRTGSRYLSTMIQAEVVSFRTQYALEMTTRTYDLESGQRLMLSDLFAEDSEAWALLAQGVESHMRSIFPGEARNEANIQALCSYENLSQADFTLSGMELTLHYFNNLIFDGKPNLTHVRFYYPQFEGMLTDVGMDATDNSRWKMVAITCDDGPKDYTSTYALAAFRKVGARVTYFTVGTQLERYGDVFQRQMNYNHAFGCHTYNHWSGYTYKKPERRLPELTKNDDLTYRLVGEAAQFFRAPGGTYPPWMEARISLPIIQWTLDTYDYTGKSAKKIFYSVRNNVKEYDIILCHDTGKYLHEAVPIFGQWLTDNGYMMVTLGEMAAAQGVELQPNVLYLSFRPNEYKDYQMVFGRD